MMDADRLTNLILTSDFTYSELEGVAVEYLKLTPSDARDIMSATGMGRKVSDLVAWAYQHELSNELQAGILGFERSKRAIREWMLTGDGMPSEPQVSSSIERRMERLEDHVNNRMLAMEQEIRRLAVAIEARGHHDGGGNWSVIFLAILVALIVAGATTTMAVMR